MSLTPPALSVRGLTKLYPGTVALDHVDLEVAPGTIHALAGANGSGKSTLVKILAGVDSHGAEGSVAVAGTTVAASSIVPSTARDLGVVFVHQDIGMFDNLSVAENIGLGSGRFGSALAPIHWRKLRAETAALVESYGLPVRPSDRVADLSPATKTMLAIARSLGINEARSTIKLLVLDEPTASLPAGEVELLASMLRACAARGQAILFISHHLPEILGLADTVTVLRDGRIVTTVRSSELSESELATQICGRSIERMFPDRAGNPSETPVLEVRGLVSGGLRDVDLTVNAGEVLGVAGLLGSGRSTLLRTVYGAQRPVAGSIAIEGKRVSIRDPKQANQLGIGYVPEDRPKFASFATLSVQENHTVASLREFFRRGRMRTQSEERDADSFIEKFHVKTAGSSAPMGSLSGGNQQKVILSRWLRRTPKLLLLDEPSQGVDVGSRSELYAAIREAADQGMGVLLVSSDLEELAHASDRVIVLRDGAVAAEFAPPPSPEVLIDTACGVYEESALP